MFIHADIILDPRIICRAPAHSHESYVDASTPEVAVQSFMTFGNSLEEAE